MKTLYQRLGKDVKIRGVELQKRQAACKRNCGADIVKNEITTHAIAAQKLVPEVRTIIEIGGQDQDNYSEKRYYL